MASALPNPQPLPLRTPHPDATAELTAQRPTPLSERTQVVVPAAPVGTKAGPGEVFDAESAVKGGRSSSAAGGAIVAKPKKSHKRLYWILAAVLIVLALVAGGIVAAENKVFTPSHPAPNLVHLTLAEAHAASSKDHFTLHLAHGVTSITVAAGSVISQLPKPGTVLKEGSTMSVVPSIGPPPVPVPSLANQTCAEGAATLAAAHLKGVCGAAQYSDSVPSGVLIGWMLGTQGNPTSAPYGATITMVPSQGHAPVTVPNIPGSYSFAQAQAALVAVGFSATQATVSSTTVAAGQVISTSPASGTAAPYGSAVTVTVSSGPPTVAVPNVLGETVAQATAALEGAGLAVSGVTGNPAAVVKGTDPATNQVVPVGSAVQILTK